VSGVSRVSWVSILGRNEVFRIIFASFSRQARSVAFLAYRVEYHARVRYSHLFQVILHMSEPPRARWRGYPPDNIWYPADNFENAPELIREFHEKYPDKAKPRSPRSGARGERGG
jgi:hypothetical protein